MGKVKLGVCQWCIPAQGVQAIALAGELGFAGVEMDMGIGKPGLELREEAVLDAFITAKEKTGLVYPALALNGIEMNQPQAEEETLALIQRAVQIARQLGADTLQMPSFGSAQMESETDFEQTVKACLLYTSWPWRWGCISALCARWSKISPGWCGAYNGGRSGARPRLSRLFA